jgi:hypothetical protein
MFNSLTTLQVAEKRAHVEKAFWSRTPLEATCTSILAVTLVWLKTLFALALNMRTRVDHNFAHGFEEFWIQ